MATGSRCRQRVWRRKRLVHFKERERVYQSPPVLVHQEDLTSRNTILNLPPGTEIIPGWGIRARSLLLNRCPVCLEADRLSLYVCGQCRQRPACRECTLQLLNGEDWLPCPVCRFSDLAEREDPEHEPPEHEPPQQFSGDGRGILRGVGRGMSLLQRLCQNRHR